MTSILLVEGPEPDRDLLWAFFNGIQCRVDMVPGMDEAKEAFGQRAYDLVITDVRPPRGDGLEIVRELHDMSQRLTPFLFISGSVSEDELMRNVDPDLFVVGLIKKPVFIVDLVYRISGLIGLPDEDSFMDLLGRLESGDAGIADLDQLLRGGGDLSRVPLSRVLYAMYETKRTGSLTVSSAGGLVRFYTFRGELIYMDSEREGDTLFSALRGHKALADVTIPEGARPGNVEEEIGLLMALRAVQPHKVPELIQELLATVLADLVRERSGGYRIQPLDPPNRFMEAVNPIKLLLATHARLTSRGGGLGGHKGSTQLVVRIPLALDLGRWKMPPAELRLANRLRGMVGKTVAIEDFMRVYSEGEQDQRLRLRAFLGMMEAIGYLDFRPPESEDDDRRILRELLEEAHRIRHLNHFQLLKVRASDDKETIKKAYLAAARQYHPDHFYERPQRLSDLANQIQERYQNAYETLVRDKARKLYLATLSEQEMEQAGISEKELHNPVRASIFWKEGERFLKVGKFPEAEQNLSEAVRFDASKAVYLAALGWVRYNLDRRRNKQAAIDDIRRAIEMSNTCDRAHYYLGLIAKDDGDWRKAELYFSRANTANPDNIEAARELRLIQRRGGGGAGDDGRASGLFGGLFGKKKDG